MVVNPPLGREIRRYPECAEKIREYMTCMNDQNSGGVSRFTGSFMSPCAPIQTEMNNCLVNARKEELKKKNKEKSAKLREKYKDFKNVETKEPEKESNNVKPTENKSDKSEANSVKIAQNTDSVKSSTQSIDVKTESSWLGGWFSK